MRVAVVAMRRLLPRIVAPLWPERSTSQDVLGVPSDTFTFPARAVGVPEHFVEPASVRRLRCHEYDRSKSYAYSVLPMGLRIAIADAGHAPMNSTDCWTVFGMFDRSTMWNPSRAKNASAVVVSRYT